MSDSLPEKDFSGVIRVVKLTSGEEVISLITEASPSKYTFNFPARLDTYFTRDPNGELYECVKLTNYLSNIKAYQINIPKEVVVYMGEPTLQLEKMYETFFATMQTDPKIVVTSGEIDQVQNPEQGLQLLNELFNNDDFVNFVNDLIDNFEGAEIIIDDDDEILEIENKEDSDPELPLNEPIQEEAPKPSKPKKRRIMNPESKKLPYEPDAPSNKPESWSDDPNDYL
jgi:hypothetical protein